VSDRWTSFKKTYAGYKLAADGDRVTVVDLWRLEKMMMMMMMTTTTTIIIIIIIIMHGNGVELFTCDLAYIFTVYNVAVVKSWLIIMYRCNFQ